MKKAVIAAVMAAAIFVVSATVNAAPNETKIERKNYEVPPNG